MISKHRWYVTEDNRAVGEGNVLARRLLVAAGGEIPDDVARRYGIFPDEAVEREEKAIEAAPENKALEMPAKVKRARKK